MQEIVKVLSGLGYEKIALIVIAASIFIDLTPAVKWNPIRSIFKYIGEAFNSSIKTEIGTFKVEVNEKFNQFQEKQDIQQNALDKLVKEQSHKEVSRLRWEIIDFKNSIVNGVKHSRGQYRHVISSLDTYLNSIEVEDMDNDYYNEVIEDGDYIRTHYEKYKDDKSLLYF
jgi:hypothetical protein